MGHKSTKSLLAEDRGVSCKRNKKRMKGKFKGAKRGNKK